MTAIQPYQEFKQERVGSTLRSFNARVFLVLRRGEISVRDGRCVELMPTNLREEVLSIYQRVICFGLNHSQLSNRTHQLAVLHARNPHMI